jgi:hypothetical protein
MNLVQRLLRGFGACVFLGLGSCAAMAQSNYTWKNVVIRGGGYVSGVLFHPTEANLIYARTDVGGVFRWENASGTWTPINDDLGYNDSQLTGVVSFAVDPNDANRLFLAAGQYLQSWGRNAAILRSADRGATWSRTELGFKLAGNADGRGAGERLQVDPNNGSILFLGTNQNGLWKSTDRGVTWAQVSAFSPASLTFVTFDARSGSLGSSTSTIYAGVNDLTTSLYRSTNGGSSWSPVPGAPTGMIPNHAEFDTNGVLYLSYANAVGPNGMTRGAIWRYNTASSLWTDISPRPSSASDQFGYGAVSASKLNPGTIVASTNDRWTLGDEIWRSVDGGASWTNVNGLDTYDNSSAPWSFMHGTAANFRPHWVTDIDIDPFNNNRVLFVTGGGIWGTDAAFGASPIWTFRNTGLEETVPLDLASPPMGASLLSAIGDIGGFRHENLDASPPTTHFFNPVNGTNTSIDFAQALPMTVVRTHSGTTRGAYSTTGGESWTNFATCPPPATTNGPGHIAVNANGTRLVWIPDNSEPYHSSNSGASWTRSTGVPSGNFAPVADRVNTNKFYVYDSNAGRVYVSTDGGQSFTAGGLVPGNGGKMRAVPGSEGHLWVGAWASGLYRSTNSGTSFSAISGVQEAYRVGVGMPATGQTHPTIFIWGKIAGTVGLYRSVDVGASWVRINDDKNQWGWINAVIGDPRVFGRVYVATGGRGIMYGSAPGLTNTAPTVSISSPAAASTFTAGANIAIEATASDANGTVASVAFYRGTTLIATDTSAPFSTTWSNVSAGTYALTAVATDNDGATATSPEVSITVNAASTPATPPASSGGGGGGGSSGAGFVAALAALAAARAASVSRKR